MSSDNDKIKQIKEYILGRLEHWEGELSKLRAMCGHTDTVSKYGRNTGNWDGVDHHWKDYECVNCGEKWRSDQ